MKRLGAGVSPVILALIVIAAVFGSLNQHFLSPENLTNLALQLTATGTIALGIVMVLLLGEIDLSAGSVSGLAAVVMSLLSVKHGVPVGLALAIAIIAALAIGLLHGALFTLLGMPSFVVTLAGLIGWQGVLLYALGDLGGINLSFDGFVARLADTWLPQWLSLLLLASGLGVWLVSALTGRRLRLQAGLAVASLLRTVVPVAATGAVCGAAVVTLGQDRGVPLLLLIFVALVVGFDLLLRHTVVGRRIFAVGGNVEAARRAGVNITAIRLLAFGLCSVLAAVGGILAASRLAAVNQNSGGSDVLLMAIAAAVIGGTSLFGGRGHTYSALLGVLVIQSISNGMLLLDTDSSVRYMVTAAVLVSAVAIDSLARKSHGTSTR